MLQEAGAPLQGDAGLLDVADGLPLRALHWEISSGEVFSDKATVDDAIIAAVLNEPQSWALMKRNSAEVSTVL
jgi:hypothetical protein